MQSNPQESFCKSKPRETWQCNSEMHTKNAKDQIAKILLKKNNLLSLDVGDTKFYFKAVIIMIKWYYNNHRQIYKRKKKSHQTDDLHIMRVCF